MHNKYMKIKPSSLTFIQNLLSQHIYSTILEILQPPPPAKMLPDQPRKAPTSRPCSNIDQDSAANSVTFFFLTFNCLFTLFRAYSNHDIPMVFFIVFIYIGYFVLDYCSTEYRKIPDQVDSPRKYWLKSVSWALYSSILFGFAYQFSTFMGFAASVVMYSVAIISSSFCFYMHFIYGAKYGGSEELNGKDNHGKNETRILETV